MRKTLLVVSNKIPFPPDGGDTSRLFNFINYLTKDWQIDLIAYERSEEHVKKENQNSLENPLSAICRLVKAVKLPGIQVTRWRKYLGLLTTTLPSPSQRYYSPEMDSLISSAIRDNTYSSMLISSLPMAQFVPAGAFGGSTVYDQVDAYYPLHFEAMKWVKQQARIYTYLDALKVKYYEKKILQGRFGKNVVVAEHDAAALRNLSSNIQVSIVPCGVDTAYFSPLDNEIPNRLVFTGTMRYGPNIDAMMFFCNDILPIIAAQVPEVKVFIVGHSVDPQIKALASNRVIVTGHVPDIRPYIASGSVVIAPFRLGSGLHVKNLEAMAMEKPIVATSRGAQGINAQPGRDLLIADEPSKFAYDVINLLKDSQARKIVGQAGRSLVLKNYSLECVGQKMNELLYEVNRQKSEKYS
jgi:polysaccharide biosynthesis protein PslH